MNICIYTYIHIYAYYQSPPYKVYNSDEFQLCKVKSWKIFGKHFPMYIYRYLYTKIRIAEVKLLILQRLNS